MANDVVIEVEARVGDAIAQMTLTAAAVRALGDEASSTSDVVGNENDGRTLSGRLGGLRRTLGNLGDRGPLGMIVRGFGNLAGAMLAPIELGAKFAQNFEQIGSVGQVLVGGLASVTIGIAGLAAAFAALTFATVALASALGTLVAIVADLVAPVTLLGGLLGGLGVGFLIAAKRAADGGLHLDTFSKKVDTLGSMFHRTSTILAQRFLPYLNELADAGKQALFFLDKVIKLPLGQAFRMIDTQGTKMLGKFVDRVAEVLSKPIRLAFRVAFEDSAFSAMVSDWWHRFTGFLFGSIEQHPIRLPSGKIIEIDRRQVDGIFQPLIDWFNRHHFTRQGIQIGRQIIRGVMNSGMRDRLVTFLGDVLKEAGKQSVNAYIQAIKTIVARAIPTWIRLRSLIIQKMKDAAAQSRDAIIAALGHAWDWVKGKVSGVWSAIVGIITKPLQISIDWPSPPSWFSDLVGGAFDRVKRITSSVPGVPGAVVAGAGSVSVARARPRGMLGANVTVVSGPLDSYSARRNTAAMISRDLERRWIRSGR